MKDLKSTLPKTEKNKTKYTFPRSTTKTDYLVINTKDKLEWKSRNKKENKLREVAGLPKITSRTLFIIDDETSTKEEISQATEERENNLIKMGCTKDSMGNWLDSYGRIFVHNFELHKKDVSDIIDHDEFEGHERGNGWENWILYALLLGILAYFVVQAVRHVH